MRQSFDMTFCCHGDCTNKSCNRFMQSETLTAFPPHRGIIMADFKTQDCGYKTELLKE